MTKTQISITVDREILRWVDEKISKKLFANRSHAVEYCFEFLRNQESGSCFMCRYYLEAPNIYSKDEPVCTRFRDYVNAKKQELLRKRK